MNRRALNLVLAVGTPVLLVALWWFGSANSTNAFFPPLEQILRRFQALWLFDHFASDVLLSLRNLAVGYAVSVVGGVLLGFVIATVPVLRAMFEPVIHFVRGIPPVALVPILITLIGFGPEMRVTSIVLAALFPTMISTIDGIRADSVFSGLVQSRDDGTVLRVLAPGKAADAGLFSATYLDPYITSAWNAYTGRTLTVVPRIDIPRPGDRYPIFYDASNPSRFALGGEIEAAAPPRDATVAAA